MSLNDIEKSNENIIKSGYLPNTPEFNVVKQPVPLHYNVNITFNTLLKKRGYTNLEQKHLTMQIKIKLPWI